MATTLTFPYNQPAGTGQGYFLAPDPNGASGIVIVTSTAGDVELRITRYNAPDYIVPVPSGTTIAVGLGNIQTIGIFAVANATGTLYFITNV